MKDLVKDAIAFFKMVGGSDALSDKGFDTGDIMPLEYCNEIVELCQKYDIEYDLEKFFKTKLEGAVKGGIYDV